MKQSNPGTITQLLRRMRDGDKNALDELMPLVFEKIHEIAERRMKREPPGHTLQATAIVSELYIWLVDAGVVFEAEQEEPFSRTVAIKLLKSQSDFNIENFVSECQNQARMKHSNIANIFDAGATETGIPYAVMEYVEGIRVTAYCDQKKLSVRSRVELFVRICEAVQHAHQKFVVHCDLKPSNVLVDSDTENVKVIDFGIARFLEFPYSV